LDENDPQPELPQTAADGSVEVAANLDVDDFAARFGAELPEGDYNTLAGFLMQLKGEMPVEGERLRWEAFAFTISEVQGHRLTRVRVRQEPDGDAGVDG
jgi:CBS domain containing-hemolysin-like protein